MEAMQAQDTEVLFCYENFDELVLMNLGQFDKKTLKSVENELATAATDKSGSAESSAGKKNAVCSTLMTGMNVMIVTAVILVHCDLLNSHSSPCPSAL